MADATTAESERSHRARRPHFRTALLVLAGLAAVAVVVWLILDRSAEASVEPVATATALRTVEAEQRDLVATSTVRGTLGHAQTVGVTVPAAGTVTSLVDDGTSLERNTVVAEIDAVPLVSFFGSTPMYRDLRAGDEGADVAIIERNLVALGYHAPMDPDGGLIDTGFEVDGIFDAATTDAVKRWQDDLGLLESGTVTRSSVVIIPGPSVVASTAANVGGRVQPGAPLATINVNSASDSFHAAHGGELELVAESGPFLSGDVVYLVDDLPVVGIVTDEHFGRDLWWGVADGPDIEAVETYLSAAGYDASGDLQVDETWDGATSEAVEDWKSDLADEYRDVVTDNTLRTSELIAVPPGTRVENIAPLSDPVPSGAELFWWDLGGTGRVVRANVDIADQAKLALGTVVDVEFPDGTVVAGAVTHVSTASTLNVMDPTAEPQVEVEIELDEVPESQANLTDLTVDIVIVDRLAAGATVVPANALVATTDGGFAVEVTDGTNTSFVAVTPGLFADGKVEVSGIEPGTTVVVPS